MGSSSPPISSLLSLILGQQSHNELKGQIDSFHASVVKSCRDDYALQDARNIVPIAELVQDNLHILEGDYQDNLLPILVQWFANEFFTWFSPPACEKCNNQLIPRDSHVNRERLSVETYMCENSTSCDYKFDFIRHDDPSILLHTRKGRCGEWANCFFLILRAMDYSARIVLDTTDHVWNEVWSESQQRWIHVDPCEAVVDCPLLYEIGWSKKLEYCLAFNKYEVTDVTPRYSKDMSSTRQTRTIRYGSSSQQSELWLSDYLDQLTMESTKYLDETSKNAVLDRRKLDIAQLKEMERKIRTDVRIDGLGGRKSGSLAWRIERGEYSPNVRSKNVIKAQSSSRSADCVFFIQYDCDRDAYDSPSEDLKIRGWQKLIYESDNIDHKFERDWKTSYLARYETCPADREGRLQWRFDLSSLKDWTKIEINIGAQMYPETWLKVRFVSRGSDEDDKISAREVKINEVNVLTFDKPEASRTKMVDLIVTLGGGNPSDSVAWQKPQLFRQARGRASEAPFLFKVLK